MDTNFESIVLTDNSAETQYEMAIGNDIAFIEYIIKDDKIHLTHTEVPAALQGRGIATALVKKVLQRIKADKRTLVPSCSFVAAYVNDHPEYHWMLSEGYQM